MNDDTETPGPLNAVGDEALEARIVAWVLGDASAFEASELERLCAERPELLVFHRRMLALHGLLADAETDSPDPEWQLPPEKRAKVEALEHSPEADTPVKLAPVGAGKRRAPVRAYIMRVAACVLLPVIGMVSYVIYAICFPDSIFSRPIVRNQFIQNIQEPSIDFLPSSGASGGGFGSGAVAQSERSPKLRVKVDVTAGDKLDETESPATPAATPALPEPAGSTTESLASTASPAPVPEAPPPPVVTSPVAVAPPLVTKPGGSKRRFSEESELTNSEMAKAEPATGLAVDAPPAPPPAVNLGGGKVESAGGSGRSEALAENDVKWSDSSATVNGRAAESTSAKDNAARGFRNGIDENTRVVTNGNRSGDGTVAPASIDMLLANRKNKETDAFAARGVVTLAKPAPDLAGTTDEKIVMNGGDITIDHGALTKNGNGTMKLSGENSYTGGTTVSGGTLAMDGREGVLGDVSGSAPTTLNYAFQTSEDMGRVSQSADAKPLGLESSSSFQHESSPSSHDSNGFQGSVQYGSQIASGTVDNVDGLAVNDRLRSPAPAQSPNSNDSKNWELHYRTEYEPPPQGPVGSVAYADVIPAEKGIRERKLSDGDSDARDVRAGLSKSLTDSRNGLSLGSGGRVAGQDADAEPEKAKAPSGLADVSRHAPTADEPVAALDHVDYDAAKKDYIESEDQLKRTKMKLLGEQIQNKIQNDAVIMHEEASPPRRVSAGEQIVEGLGKAVGGLFSDDAEAPAPTAAKAVQEQANEEKSLAHNKPTSMTRYNAVTPTLAPQQQQALRDLEEKVEDKRKLLSTIVRTKRIVYQGNDSYFRQSRENDQGAQPAMDLYSKLEQEKMQLESQIESLRKYDSDQKMVYASGLNLPENIIKTLYPMYMEKKRALESMKSGGLGDNNPQVIAASQEVGNLKKDLDEGVTSLSDTLRAQLDLAKDRLAKADAMRNSKSDEEIKKGLDAVDYVEAKKEYETAQAELKKMRLKVSEAQKQATVQPANRQEAQRGVIPSASILAAMGEGAANRDPYSTFSLHVSDASFKLAKAALDRGNRPDPLTVRPEEFYNAFDYGDPAPAAGEPVACTLEQSAHPVLPQRNLVRIAARVGSAGRAGTQPLVLTVLLDSSGSMEREDRRAGLKNAVAQLASLLHAEDRVTLVTFSRTPRLLADQLPGSQAAKLKQLVSNTPSEGGTNLEEALKLGGALARRQKLANAQNRIVLLTDGAANLGDADPEHLAGLIHDLRQQGIAFDAAGIGADGLNDRMLEQLTRNGNGRYYVINNPEDADANFAKQLAGAFRPAAENVKVQVRFNPDRVGRYKLIGFEQHRLRTEDFRNDKVDAAELAADEAGVALYQVETLPEGHGEVGEVSIRFRDAASGEMVERTWTIPYDEKAPAFDQAKPSMQLATLADLVAEKLRGSELGKVVDFQTLAGPIAVVRGNYQNNPRVADLGSMIEKLK